MHATWPARASLVLLSGMRRHLGDRIERLRDGRSMEGTVVQDVQKLETAGEPCQSMEMALVADRTASLVCMATTLHRELEPTTTGDLCFRDTSAEECNRKRFQRVKGYGDNMFK